MRLVPVLAAALAVALPLTAAADHIRADDVSIMIAPTNDFAAVLMRLENTGSEADRLLRVEAGDLATSVSLQTHVEEADGAVRVVAAEDGIDLPAGATRVVGRAGDHALGRDGDHAVLIALAAVPESGSAAPLVLVFESGVEMTLEAPIQRHPTAAAAD